MSEPPAVVPASSSGSTYQTLGERVGLLRATASRMLLLAYWLCFAASFYVAAISTANQAYNMFVLIAATLPLYLALRVRKAETMWIPLTLHGLFGVFLVGLVSGTMLSSPYNASKPEVKGVAKVGQVVEATAGKWTLPGNGHGYKGDPTRSSKSRSLDISYQWLTCRSWASKRCRPITDANARVYTVQRSDAGKALQVQVTISKGAGSTTAASEPRTVATDAPARPSATR